MARERGFSLLAMVMILLLLSLLALGALHREILSAMRFHVEERRYLQAYNQAASALNWGIVQHWTQPDQQWQCRSPSAETFTACIRQTTENDIVLLRGESVISVAQQPIRLYRRLQPIAETPLENQLLIPLEQGWLDLCPLRQDVQCAD